MINLQTALDQVGSSGKYQLRIFLLFSVVMFALSCQIMGPTYTYIKPYFLCDGNICKETIETCKGNISMDPDFKYKNVITDFHLYCERDYLISIGSSINFLGSVLGGIIMSFIADLKGRRFTFLLCWSFSTISFIGILFSVNIEMLLIMNFIMGFFEVGAYILIPVILNEICSTKLRQVYTLGILIVWSLTEIVLAIAFYYIENWRTIQIWFIVFPSILVLIFNGVILETPKFYFTKNEQKEALIILNTIAKINRKPEIKHLDLYQQDKQTGKKNYYFLDLFKFQSLRLPSIGFFCISYTLHLIYYGGQYGMKDISNGNMIYIMGITVGFSECLMYSLTAFFIHKIKRRIALMWSFILSIIGCGIFISYGIHSYELSCSDCIQETLTILLLCLIRIFNTLGFGIQGLFSNEFYPTSIRAIGSGFLFSAGILGSFTSPYITGFGKLLNFNPFVLIAIVSLMGSFGTLMTKETKGKPLQDQINEVTKMQMIHSNSSGDEPLPG